MQYSDYIKLGFKRLEMNDKVLFNQTGYYGFILTKKLGEWSISLCDGEFDTPKLYFNNDYICTLTQEKLLKILKP